METAAPTDPVKSTLAQLSVAVGRIRMFQPLFHDTSDMALFPYSNIDPDKFEILVAVPELDGHIYTGKYAII